jgi:hypothetical protein
MSTEAGGEVIIFGVLAAGAAAAIAIGGIAVGAGYMVCKGGYRAVKAGKEAWDAHLKALEEERQKRLQELRKEDEALMKRLQERFAQWAQEGQNVLRQHEEQVHEKLAKKRSQLMEEERERAKKSAAWKRIESLDEELKAFKKESPSLPSYIEKEAYQSQLEKARSELTEMAKHSEQVETGYADFIDITTPAATPTEKLPVDLNEYSKQLGVYRAKFAGLLFLSDEDRSVIKKKIIETEKALEDFSDNNVSSLKGYIQELQNHLNEAVAKNQENRKVWEEAQTIYFSLHDQYTTATQDPSLKEIIKDPLDELDELLKKTREFLTQPQGDVISCFEELEKGQALFNKEVDNSLLKHQQGLNYQVKDVLANVLDDLGYADKKIDEKEGAIRVIGTGSAKHKKASVSFSLNPDGHLSVDISRRGFKNQSACNKEFFNVQQALQKHGILVELKEYKKTWMTEMAQFLEEKLKNMGYPQETINVKDVEEDKLITAYHPNGDIAEIRIDAKTGEYANVKGLEMQELKTVDLAEEEEEVEETEKERIEN